VQVIVDNLPISYTVSGKGRAILMLHGWGDSSATFAQLSKSLGSEYMCISLDLPGFGSSGIPTEDLQLSDFADYVTKFLEKIGVADIYAMIGHSNGGAIAISGLASGRLSTEKLILLASAGVRDDQRFKKTVLKSASKTVKFATKILPQTAREKLRKKSYQAIGSEMFVNEDMQETFKNIVGHDVQQEASKLTFPTLLIYGREDTATPTRYGQILSASIKGSKYVEVEAGHFVHIDKPDEVVGLIKDFL